MTLLLDAAFPPAGELDWAGVLRSAGAQGSMVYVFDPYINPDRWTPDYVHALQVAGFAILPVYVTFNQPIGHARQVMAEYGWNSGPLMGDIEQGSFPSPATFQAWCQDLRANGYTPVVYGTASTLDSYRRYADKAYLASYIQRTLQPIPDLNGVSYDGWQYANSFNVNGVEVDASVTSIPLIGGGGEEDLTPDQSQKLDFLYNDLIGGTVDNPAGAMALLKDLVGKMGFVYNDLVQGVQDNSQGLPAALAAVLADVEFLKAHPASSADPTVGQAVARIEAALKQA